MIGIIIFMAFSYAVMQFGKPIHVAITYTILGALISLFNGTDISSLFIWSIAVLVYTSFVFFLINYFRDGILIPYAITMIGGIALWLWPLWVHPLS